MDLFSDAVVEGYDVPDLLRILDEAVTGTPTGSIDNLNNVIVKTTTKMDNLGDAVTPGARTTVGQALDDSAELTYENVFRNIDDFKRVYNSPERASLISIFRRGAKNTFKRISETRAAAKAKNAPIEIEGNLYDLVGGTVINGRFRPHYVIHPTGLWAYLKGTSTGTKILLGWILVMGPWFTIDNSQFWVYLLRRADIISDLWGDQWDDNVVRRKDAYFALMNAPCTEQYQAQYVAALTGMRTLLDGADPIPEDKIEHAKYVLSVLYGFDIGDPKAAIKAEYEIDYAAWKEWYFQVTQTCFDPLQPPDGFDLTQFYDDVMYNVKIENVVDGDTFDVSSDDIMWPHGIPLRVRTLGVNTPEGGALHYLIRRLTTPGGTEERHNADITLYGVIGTWTTTQLWHALVTLRLDTDDIYGEHNRPIVVIEKGGVDIGEKDLRMGFGPVFFYSPNARMSDIIRDGKTRQQIYLEAEDEARTANIGVWPFFLECSCWFDKSTYALDDNAILYYANAPVDSEFKLINPSGVTTYSDVVSGSGNVTKKLDKVGPWRLTLVKAGEECSAQDTATVTLCPVPVASFTVSSNSIDVGEWVQFTDTSTVVAGYPITSWLWNFGDGTTSTETNPLHQFNSPCDPCTVRLTVTNVCGSDYDEDTIIVKSVIPTGTLTIKAYKAEDLTELSATVSVDDVDKGNTPVSLTLPAGPHTVRVEEGEYNACYSVIHDDHFSVGSPPKCVISVNVVANQTLVAEVHMTNVRAVMFNSDPGYATVYLKPYGAEDSEYVQITAYESLPVGDYMIKFQKPGYDTLEAWITLTETRVTCNIVTSAMGACYTEPLLVVPIPPPGLYAYAFLVIGYLKESIGPFFPVTFDSYPVGASVFVD